MRAAARHALRPQRRGTRVPPYGIFTDFVGVGVPDDPFAPHPPKNLSLRTGDRRHRCGKPYSPHAPHLLALPP